MKKIKFISALLGLGFLVVFVSCGNQTWEDHYGNADVESPTQTVMEYLKTQDDLTTFCQMLEISGYDTVLSLPLSHTVWAPVNSALAGVSLSDVPAVTELVQTHIAYFSISTSNTRESKVPVLSGKKVSFVGDKYGDCSLVKKNINVSNGLVHTINGYVEYMPNTWEYMQRVSDLDSISKYLVSLSQLEFDPYNSTELGTNANGQPIYDSVFIEANDFLDKVADLSDEDTTYTVLFPNNKAWEDYYSVVSRYYQVLESDGGASRQKKLSHSVMVQDLAFPGRLELNALPDSLVSTSRHTFYQPEELFKNTVKQVTSNGYVYVADSIGINPMSSWFDTIRIEAENATYGRTFANAVLYTRLSYGKGFEASGDAYLEVGVSSTASAVSKIYVDFPIPNVLSAKYNIYCVFLPETIDYSTSRPNKISVMMSYVNASGKLVDNEQILSKVSTNGSDTTKLFICQHDFSYCNMYNRKESKLSDIKTKIRIRNEQRRETTSISEVMRIDCLIFEPVME